MKYVVIYSQVFFALLFGPFTWGYEASQGCSKPLDLMTLKALLNRPSLSLSEDSCGMEVPEA